MFVMKMMGIIAMRRIHYFIWIVLPANHKFKKMDLPSIALTVTISKTVSYTHLDVYKRQISIIIPCHRVVGAKGNLTGYGGGLDKKIQLLTLENVAMDAFYRPKKGTAL